MQWTLLSTALSVVAHVGGGSADSAAVGPKGGDVAIVEPAAWWETDPDFQAREAANNQRLNTVEPPQYDWPPFANWDCIGETVGKFRIADWDSLYRQVVAGVRGELGRGAGGQAGANAESDTPFFVLPEEAVLLLATRAPEAREECPLGTLYFLVLYTYEMMLQSGGEDTAVRQSSILVQELRRYPFFIIAGSRWPVFEALQSFAYLHEPQGATATRITLCQGVRGDSGVNWDVVLAAANSWSEEQMRGLEPGQGDPHVAQLLKDAADAVYKDTKGRGAAAQVECPFGFLFLCTTQVLASAMRLTGSFEPWSRALDKMLAELPFFSIAGSGWPTFRMLAFFASLSKGSELPLYRNFQGDIYRFGSAHPVTKRFRQYGDLRLGVAELAGPWGGSNVDELASLSGEAWFAQLARQDVMRRPALVDALEAVASVVRSSSLSPGKECGASGMSEGACVSRGCFWFSGESPSCQRPRPRRKVVGVTFVWGERWASLVPRFVAWAVRLNFGVVVVAMGDACRSACETAVAALGGAAVGGVACWDPLRADAAAAADGGIGQLRGRAERGSILQRHALVHILLHLGIDAVAFDFDTFFFSDPRRRLEDLAEAEGVDVMMARHLDADCMNMGLLYIRASTRSALWYRKYLAWLHLHPFEREQRGANALLGFTKQKVSFPPKDLPPMKVAALDDHNEFSSSRGGWLGAWNRLVFFHWVNPTQTTAGWSDIKISDLQALYEAALHPGTDILAAGGSFAWLLGRAQEGSPLYAARALMESMRIPMPPERAECW